ncbi:uncharacterized protein SETTUDRAFT_161671 [Exserohilum turcica Et28A]|uniref:Alpha/beta hydrolase fold-3 domain-containing protein n=1 Tax=Exserohilum turcicum (strain 28A) TaxID=671987 RepID=R0JYJ7_EXST2|nr:uncharacterized protein SETTUDRAFT_161671 [Exserohilum turcica Et28A]EOA85978.1 hypothetical protein SETTUDRAFT_161671 [Exserohilum turcica Et28A]
MAQTVNSILDVETMLSLATIDPEFENKTAIKRHAASFATLGPTPVEVALSEIQYPARDGAMIRAKLYQPKMPPKNGSPLIVFFHSGGFCVGSPEGEELTCRNFVQAFGAVAVSVSYRLAPEFPFPYAINDAWDALRWIAEKATSLAADPSLGFVVGGTSAGGSITATLTHLARDEGLAFPLTGQYLAMPMISPLAAVPAKYRSYFLSQKQNRNAPVLSGPTLDMLISGYKPDENDSVRYSILNHPRGHERLPPAVFQIAGLDPLRDEAIIYEHILSHESGCKTKLYLYPGLPHVHFLFFPSLEASKKFRMEQIEGMGWLLDRKPDFTKVVTGRDASPSQ